MGRKRIPITNRKRNFSISLHPELIEKFETTLVNLQKWAVSKYEMNEVDAQNCFTRSSVIGEVVELIGSPEGYLMLQGVIGGVLKTNGVKTRESDTRSFLDDGT